VNAAATTTTAATLSLPLLLLLVYAVAVAASGGWSFVFGEREIDRSIDPSIARGDGEGVGWSRSLGGGSGVGRCSFCSS
jgi:hypothetical protein